MKKIILILMIILLNTSIGFAEPSQEIPVGYVKLHSGAVIPIEDMQPASGRYLNVNSTPNAVYTTPTTNYNPHKNPIEPKFNALFGRGFNFFGLNAGNFNFGVMK